MAIRLPLLSHTEERRAAVLPLAFALVVPFAIGWFAAGAAAFLDVALGGFLVFVLPVYALARILYRWAVEDEPFGRAVARDLPSHLRFTLLGSDAPHVGWPLVTLSLVAANTCVFWLVEEPWTYGFVADEPGHWQWTSWVSVFLHGDLDHLAGNMLFLWIFGSALEGRLTRRRLLSLYLAAGFAAYGVALIGPIGMSDQSSVSIGASGAIAGLMGVFVVRCPNRRLSLVATQLGLPLPLAPSVRVPAVLLIGFYFAVDVAGAREIAVTGFGNGVGHWAHVGGYLFGIAAGFACGLHRAGAWEELTLRASATDEEDDSGRAAAARDAVLAQEPDHVELRLVRARERARVEPGVDAGRDYEHVIHRLMATDRRRAADIFVEHWRKHLRPLELRDQLSLTSALVSLGHLDAAARALEQAAEDPRADRELRATAWLRAAALLAELGLIGAAEVVYGRVVAECPGTSAAGVAAARLAQGGARGISNKSSRLSCR